MGSRPLLTRPDLSPSELTPGPGATNADRTGRRSQAMPTTCETANADATPGAASGAVLFTRADLARRWQASEPTVAREVRRGRLKPLKVGRLVRFCLAEVERYESGLGVPAR